MGKINWSNYGKSREDLIAEAEARKQAIEENAARLERYGTTTEEDLAATQADENYQHRGRRQAKVFIEPARANDLKRSQELAYWAKNDPGWDAAIMKLTNDVAFSPFYGRTGTGGDAVSLAQDAYLKMRHGGIRAARSQVRGR